MRFRLVAPAVPGFGRARLIRASLPISLAMSVAIAASGSLGSWPGTGGRVPMSRLLPLFCALFFLSAGAVNAQSAGPPVPPTRSGSLGTCNASTQRICDDGFRSCNTACEFSTTAGCTDRCCSQLTTCLHQRQCDTSGLNCFAGPSFETVPGVQSP
jgi:hypothetical protein